MIDLMNLKKIKIDFIYELKKFFKKYLPPQYLLISKLVSKHHPMLYVLLFYYIMYNLKTIFQIKNKKKKFQK